MRVPAGMASACGGAGAGADALLTGAEEVGVAALDDGAGADAGGGGGTL